MVTTLVRGQDQDVLIDIAKETTPGTDPGSDYIRLAPLMAETMTVERAAFPPPREITSNPALTTIDAGRATYKGTITVFPSYNGQAFWVMLAAAHGGPEVVQSGGKLIGGAAAVTLTTGYSAHRVLNYSYKSTTAGSISGVGQTFTIRIWKSGSTNAGTVEIFTGCVITGFDWQQPELDRPHVVFSILATGMAPTAASGLTLTPMPSTTLAIKSVRARDFANRSTSTNLPGISKVGATVTGTPPVPPRDLNISSFNVAWDGHYDQPPAFINAPDSLSLAGHADLWECSGEFSTLLEQEYNNSNSPRNDFVTGTASRFRMRYVSDFNAAVGTVDATVESKMVPYAIDIYLPAVTWTSVEDPIADAGVIHQRVGFQAFRGTVPAAETSGLNAQDCMILISDQTDGQSSGGYGPVLNEDAMGPSVGAPGMGETATVALQTSHQSFPTVAGVGFVNPNKSLTDDSNFANGVAADETLTFSGNNFAPLVDSNDVVTGFSIYVRAKGSSSDASVLKVGLKLSWDGGSTWTSQKLSAALTDGTASYFIGSADAETPDDWGHTWTYAQLSALKARLTTVLDSGGGTDAEWDIEYVAAACQFTSTP